MKHGQRSKWKSESTAVTVLLDEHYKDIGIYCGWEIDRVHRLCRWLNVTPLELGKMFCIQPKMMSIYKTAGKFPSYIALHFAQLERWYIHKTTGVDSKPIIPIHLFAK